MDVNGDYVTDNGSYDYNDPQYIVVHYTAGADGVTAEANARYYYNNGERIQCGTHYFLGDDGVYQSTPEDRGAWTNGNYDANTHAISIEVACGSTEPCFTDTERSLLRELVCDLMERYGIDADHVIRHFDVADHFGGSTVDPHKHCPRPYIDDDAWAELHAYITGKEDDMTFDDVWFGETVNDAKTPATGSGTTPANLLWEVAQELHEVKEQLAELSAKIKE